MILSLLLTAALAAAPEETVPQVDSIITYKAPKGWKTDKNENGVYLSKGADEIDLRVNGGKDATYETLEDYAKSLDVFAPTTRSEISAAGVKTWLYTSQRSHLGDHPDVITGVNRVNAPRYTVLLPVAGQRYLVLEYSELLEAPTARGRKAFEAFLQTVKFKKSKPR